MTPVNVSLNKLVKEVDSNDLSTHLAIIAKVVNGVGDAKEKIKLRLESLNSKLITPGITKEEFNSYKFAIQQLKDVLKWLPK